MVTPEHAYADQLGKVSAFLYAVLRNRGSETNPPVLTEIWEQNVLPMFADTQWEEGLASTIFKLVLSDDIMPAPAAFQAPNTITVSPAGATLLTALFPLAAPAAFLTVLIHELMHAWQHQTRSTLGPCEKETQAVALTDLWCAWANPPLSRVHRRGLMYLLALEKVIQFPLSVAECYCRAVNGVLQDAPGSFGDMVEKLGQETTYSQLSR